ncbi:lipoyl(octanoyl) transferase LipB [Bacterioplanoides sp.]|uniref:lipoyl(octanoyl) transferase LipB n=1 Tax=Bacterioplanoides sp. TaxID=2066072 RepID=UPI003B00E60F
MNSVVIRHFSGLQDYQPTYQRMVDFTESRDADSVDELWFLQHERVFTQGQAGKAEHVLMPGDIPVIQSNRGGQVTYHGPGQLMVYLMIDIQRKGLGPRQLVSHIEEALVATLKTFGIDSAPRADAPGVYTKGRKIASLGLRIKQGRSFHGLALNIDLNLEPFQRINPCGYSDIQMTRIADELDDAPAFDVVMAELQQQLVTTFGYDSSQLIKPL